MGPPFKYMITWRPIGHGYYEVWLRGPAVLLLLILYPVTRLWQLCRLMAGGWKYGAMVRL